MTAFPKKITRKELVSNTMAAADRPLTIAELAAELPSITPASLSPILTQLKDMELIQKLTQKNRPRLGRGSLGLWTI